MAEVTAQGYKLKTQNEYFADERDRYLAIDSSWNLDPSTPDGLKLASDAEIWGALDETIQQAYNSKDPNKATRVDLDTICALTGTVRNSGTPSNVTLTLTGVPGTVITAGKTVESVANGSKWTIDQTMTLDVSGSATVGATCTVVGPTEAGAATITRISDTVGGWTAVTNAAPATPGTEVEVDSSLRIKRATAVGRPGNNQIDSTLGELYAVSGVRRVKAYENDTNSASVSADNPYGLPAHSMSYIIDGGADADVAMAIYIKKNPGVLLNQAATPVSVVVTSPKYPSNQKNIRFSRPLYVDMNIVVTIKNDGGLPATVSDEIKQAIIDFAAGDLIEAEWGFKVQGFDIGESVPYFTISTPINKVIGAYGNSYIQSLTLNGSQANVTINYNQLSRWTTANITVNIV